MKGNRAPFVLVTAGLVALLLWWISRTYQAGPTAPADIAGVSHPAGTHAETPGSPTGPEAPGRSEDATGRHGVETLTIELGAPDERLRHALKFSSSFAPDRVLPEDAPWPAPETFKLVREYADPEAILAAASREGLVPGERHDDDPWGRVLAAEVARIQRTADRAAARASHFARFKEQLGLPPDAPDYEVPGALDTRPDLFEAFWAGLLEADLSVAMPSVALLDDPDAPPLARDLVALYALEAAAYAQDTDKALVLGLDLLDHTDDRPVAREALQLLQNHLEPALDDDALAALEAYAEEEPDLLGLTAQLALRGAWAAGDHEAAAAWVERIDAWAAERCPCAGAATDPDLGNEYQCTALCEASAALRPTLLGAGRLQPRGWRDQLRLAAVTCHAEAPLDAASEGYGAWTGAWTWTDWPPIPWTRCFVAVAGKPPHPEGDVVVRLDVVPLAGP
jgi:hypothetical protein